MDTQLKRGGSQQLTAVDLHRICGPETSCNVDFFGWTFGWQGPLGDAVATTENGDVQCPLEENGRVAGFTRSEISR